MTEHFNGNYPLWLAPVQARVLSFKDTNAKDAEEVYKQLDAAGYRVELDVSSGTVDAKVRDAELQKIPYVLVMGDKEVENGTVAVRQRGVKGVKYGVKLDDFKKQMEDEVASKKMSLKL
jgi:threonyl-tRNA synthetase